MWLCVLHAKYYNQGISFILASKQKKNYLQVKTGYCSSQLLTVTVQTWVMVVALYLILAIAVSVGTWQLEFTQERMVPCWSGVERKNRQCSLLPGCRCNVASFVVHPTLWVPRTSLSSLCQVFVTAVNTKQDWHSRQPQTDAGRESLDSWNNRKKNVKGAILFKGAFQWPRNVLPRPHLLQVLSSS